MNSGLGSLRIARWVPAAAICLIAGGAVYAQEPASPPLEGVTVEAARIVEVGHNQYGGPRQEVSLRRGVKYSDLDLTTQAGVNEFNKRIDETAQSMCQELDHMYPLGDPQKKTCASNATKGAKAEARKIIEAKQAAAKAK